MQVTGNSFGGPSGQDVFKFNESVMSSSNSSSSPSIMKKDFMIFPQKKQVTFGSAALLPPNINKSANLSVGRNPTNQQQIAPEIFATSNQNKIFTCLAPLPTNPSTQFGRSRNQSYNLHQTGSTMQKQQTKLTICSNKSITDKLIVRKYIIKFPESNLSQKFLRVHKIVSCTSGLGESTTTLMPSVIPKKVLQFCDSQPSSSTSTIPTPKNNLVPLDTKSTTHTQKLGNGQYAQINFFTFGQIGESQTANPSPVNEEEFIKQYQILDDYACLLQGSNNREVHYHEGPVYLKNKDGIAKKLYIFNTGWPSTGRSFTFIKIKKNAHARSFNAQLISFSKSKNFKFECLVGTHTILMEREDQLNWRETQTEAALWPLQIVFPKFLQRLYSNQS